MSKPACLTWTIDESGLNDWHRDECAMCGGSAKIAGRMVMDHDHATGLKRGWLCRRSVARLPVGRLRDRGRDMTTPRPAPPSPAT